MKKKVINQLLIATLLGIFITGFAFAQKGKSEKGTKPKKEKTAKSQKQSEQDTAAPDSPPVNTTGNDPNFQYHFEAYDDRYSVSKPWELAIAPQITFLHSSQQEKIGGYGNYDYHVVENTKPGFGGMLGVCRHWASDNKRWNVGAGLFLSYNSASFVYTHTLYHTRVATDSIHGKVNYGVVSAYLPVMLRWYVKPSKFYLSTGPYFMPALMNLSKTDFFAYQNAASGSESHQNINVPPKTKMSMGLHAGIGAHLGSTLELELRVNKSLMVVSESPNLGTIMVQAIIGLRF